MKRFKWVLICSPFKGDTVENTLKARKYCKFAVEHIKLPICPHIYFTQFMDDGNPVDRSLGMTFGIDLMSHCTEIWVFGDYISPGMQMEIDTARDLAIPVKRFSDAEVDEYLRLCKEGKEGDDGM